MSYLHFNFYSLLPHYPGSWSHESMKQLLLRFPMVSMSPNLINIFQNSGDSPVVFDQCLPSAQNIFFLWACYTFAALYSFLCATFVAGRFIHVYIDTKYWNTSQLNLGSFSFYSILPSTSTA